MKNLLTSRIFVYYYRISARKLTIYSTNLVLLLICPNMEEKIHYAVSGHLIEPNLNRILIGDIHYNVEPIVMDLLMLFLSNAGKPLSREEIILAVWKGKVVGDGSLSRNVASIRKLLDNNSNNLSCIKTIPKVGYLFQASVKTVSASNNSQQLNSHLLPSINSNTIKSLISSIFLSKISYVVSIIFLSALYYFNSITMNNFENSQSKSTESQIKSEKQPKQNHSPYKVNHQITLSPKNKKMAFCFDGIDDYHEIDSSETIDIGIGNLSVTAWVKTEAMSTAVIIDQRREHIEGNVQGYSLHIYDGQLGFQLADGNGKWECKFDPNISSCTNFSSDTFISDNQWHFVAVTVDRNNTAGLNFFIDKSFIKSANPTMRKGSLTTQEPLRIGSRSSSFTGLFPGDIGEVKIFNYELSAEEIVQQYEKGLSRSCEPNEDLVNR